VPGPEQGSWTYDDYASLPDDGQWYEVVNGVLVMAPAPDGPHQDAVLRIAHYLLMHVEFAGLGKVRVAPFDVQLSPKDVFQPDVFVVLNTHLDRLQKKKMIGAPACGAIFLLKMILLIPWIELLEPAVSCPSLPT
jgi:Uma2 family endonuclease